MKRVVRVFGTLGFVAVGLVSCGGGAGGAAKAVRADAPTAKDALGATSCTNPSEEIEPWVIDLAGDQRGALKAAMDRGVVVVSYDCKQLKVLRNCQVAGNYEYSGTGFNEDSFRLADADSMKATLSSGAALAAKMEADLKRGTALDVAYAVVGESNTTVPSIGRAQLRGADCKAATHFVATASLGAFAMRSSTDSQAGAAAEIFGQGASATSSSSASKTSGSGNRVVCQKAQSSDRSPVAECDIPLKLRLVPIAEDKTPVVRASGGGFRAPASCPPGTVRSGVMCVTPTKAVTKTCKQGDAKSCEDECKRGDGASCSILGWMYEKGKGVQEDPRRALELYEQGCAKRDINGCTGMGFVYSKGLGIPADKAKAASLFKEACEKGNGRACSGIGHQLRLANDVTGAIPWMDKGCSLGYVRACFYTGSLLMKQNKDLPRAYKAHERACLGNDDRGCLAQAGMLAGGIGVAASTSDSLALKDRALKDLEKKCDASDADACEALGDWHMGVYDKSAKHPEQAIQYFGKACSGGVDSTCMDLAQIMEKGAPPIPPNAQAAKQLYDVACIRSQIPEACAKVGKKPGAAAAPTTKTRKR